MGAESCWIARALLSATIFLVFLPEWSIQNKYCSITKDHTLCKFPGIGPRCKGLFDRGISSQDRDLIMHMHNQYRQLVATGNERRGVPGPQPSAANMRQMEWDDELAASAQRLADQCKYNHDCLNCRKVDRFLTGQNLYQFSENVLRDGSNWPQAINAWYDEVAEFRPSSIDVFDFVKKLGHFTQMVWADTYRVGCGYSYYNEGKWNRKLYICNYGPAGNIITTPMYTRGSPCSACPEGTYCSNQYPGLCADPSAKYQYFAPGSPPSPRPTSAARQPPRSTTVTTTTTTRPTTTTTTTTTTSRPTTTTIIPTYNEIETNELDFDNRFGFPSRRRTRPNQNQIGSRSQYSTSTTTNRAPTVRQSYYTSRITSTSPSQGNYQYQSTRRPATITTSYQRVNNNNNYNYNYNNQNQYTTARTTTTTTTTAAPYYEQNYYNQPAQPSYAGGVDYNIESQVLATLSPSTSRFSTSAGQSGQLTVSRGERSPVSTIQDVNSILLYCDFDYAKCPIRFTGDSWNYSVSETQGFGRSFETVVSPTHLTNLYIRSIMHPQGEGNICLHFRFVNYRFSPDGTPAKSGSKPLSLRVTAGTLRQKPKVVEIPDISQTPWDWMTARIQFRDLQSMFLLIFQLPTNYLQDNVYVAIDDVLVTKGLCHT